jgi:protein-S-isoprenylcysteine O-methyltransferase Ste14
MIMPPNWLPPVIGSLGLAAIALRTMALRRIGVRTWVLPLGDDAEGLIGRTFLALVALYSAIVAASAFTPSFMQTRHLDTTGLRWLGNGLILSGLLLVLLAQSHMGPSLRIGIATDELPRLVTSGLFRYSRNPIFLGMLIAATGIAMAVPHTICWVALAVTYTTISVQIRLEERFLRESVGEDYRCYCDRVDRWLSWPCASSSP